MQMPNLNFLKQLFISSKYVLKNCLMLILFKKKKKKVCKNNSTTQNIVRCTLSLFTQVI